MDASCLRRLAIPAEERQAGSKWRPHCRRRHAALGVVSRRIRVVDIQFWVGLGDAVCGEFATLVGVAQGSICAVGLRHPFWDGFARGSFGSAVVWWESPVMCKPYSGFLREIGDVGRRDFVRGEWLFIERQLS
jgi:hypothetical protein